MHKKKPNERPHTHTHPAPLFFEAVSALSRGKTYNRLGLGVWDSCGKSLRFLTGKKRCTTVGKVTRTSKIVPMVMD